MKKKILISLVACFIAAGSFVHYNFAQNNHITDISLADISVMAQADGESGGRSNECWTNATMGGIYTITPCGAYDGGWIPPYECGTPIPFCWAGGQKRDCRQV